MRITPNIETEVVSAHGCKGGGDGMLVQLIGSSPPMPTSWSPPSPPQSVLAIVDMDLEPISVGVQGWPQSKILPSLLAIVPNQTRTVSKSSHRHSFGTCCPGAVV
ncbi:hypothetical protein E2562_001395 [Oryza meyeriana var. granulata]|uniref:Uncharacterized protein n=1 Tax=Oryza meyeriana var. granulata TaxID=110450 RepID=A0A6G1DBN1_9ORYZ|nr:hypothetical protein E2562_001395 [Oryza meyeriana var. granulata]